MLNTLQWYQIGLRPYRRGLDKLSQIGESMKTLKEKMIDDLQTGGVLSITFKMYESYDTKDNQTEVGSYIRGGQDTFYKILGCDDLPYFIDIKDIRDDLTIFNPNYKDAYISKITEPSNYYLKYFKLKKPRMTKKEIEDILGYEIEIVEE